jgi:hypothetical protein
MNLHIVKILVLHHAFGRDDVLLEDSLLRDPLDPSQPLMLGFKVAKGEGETWAHTHFPGIPLESVNAFGEHTPVPFSAPKP